MNEYREYIEKDRALERRFQPILVGEPTVEDTISILRGLKEKFESHHGVKITDNAIIAAVTLSNRYITNRFLPDKAIDLIDEACASIRVEIESIPTELDELNRKIKQLEIEREALEKERDKSSKKRLEKVVETLNKYKADQSTLTKKWEDEKQYISKAKDIKVKLDKARFELSNAFSSGNYERASQIQYKEIPEMEKELNKIECDEKKDHILSEVVTEDEIAKIVTKQTNITVSKIAQGDKEKVLHLKETLEKRVIGQDNAITLVSYAIIRQRAGIKIKINQLVHSCS